ncbi:MAG: ADOP family duplicated permease [Terriglobales bacterium]
MGELWRRVQMLLTQRRWRRELEEEIRLHLEMRGNARTFGNDLRLREWAQAQWGWTWLETWVQDVRHGLRRLRRTPLITALALVSLGLGIGATTALFSLSDATLLRPLAVSHPGQLAQIYSQAPQEGAPSPWLTPAMWTQIQEHQDVFSGVLAWASDEFYLRDGGGQPPVWGAWVSGSYFATLGVRAEAGRLLGPRARGGTCAREAVISDAFWRGHFRAAPAALGAELALGSGTYTVTGVLPPEFLGTYTGKRDDIILPLCADKALAAGPDAWVLAAMGRLRPGVSRAQASARLAALAPGWMPAKRGDRRWLLLPGAQGMNWLQRRYGLVLALLMGVALLLLLVACANLAALMLARAEARRKEIEVRRALGASRGRLVRQLLTESLVLAAGGTAAGILFAAWASRAAARFMAAQLNLAPDGRMLLATAGLMLMTAALVGVAPALRSSRTGLAGAKTRRAGQTTAVLAVIASVALLAGAGLFVRSLVNLEQTRLGFDPAPITLIEVRGAAGRGTLKALRSLPGVEAASASLIVPVQGLQWDGWARGGGSSGVGVYFNAVSPGYFATLRTPLRAGRDFAAQDRQGAALVAIVNRAAARALFPGGGAMGRKIQAGAGAYEVIGVAEDAKYQGVRDAAPPQMYFALAQEHMQAPGIHYELRSELPLGTVAAEARQAMRQTDPTANFVCASYAARISATLSGERMLAWLAGLFGGLALLLTAIGLYGIMAYRAERRKREFGIRMALGSRPGAVLRLALGDAGRVLALGVGIGAGLSWIAARTAQATLSKLLYGLPATDTATLTAAVVVLAAVSLFAAWLPARRAARRDPMATLRED